MCAHNLMHGICHLPPRARDRVELAISTRWHLREIQFLSLSPSICFLAT